MTAQFLTTQGPNGRLAYHKLDGAAPGIVFLHGYNSNMDGDKALALAAFCAAQQRAYLRFDCHAHGQSAGDFKDFTIGGAIQDTLYMLDTLTTGPQIIIGSSMGGWLAMQAALQRLKDVKAIIGLAPAPDFSDQLYDDDLNDAQRKIVDEKGFIELPSQYGGTYMITKKFVEDGRRHFVTDRLGELQLPLRILHGQQDSDVDWRQSLAIAARWGGDDVSVNIIKGADHRLSRPEDLEALKSTLKNL